MQKNDSQLETAYVTRDSVALLIFTHFYVGEFIVKYPFRDKMLPEITRETVQLHFAMCQPIHLIYTSYDYEG